MIKKLLRPAKEVVRRGFSQLKWRMSSEGNSTLATFASLKDSMVGMDCILMCNGPSLNKVPFEKLHGCYVIGMNKINLLFERTDMRPNMIVAINPFVIEQNAEFFNQTDITLMLSNVGVEHVQPRQNVNFLNSDRGSLHFSFNPGALVCECATVTYTALQIAFYMGFSRVAIVGADHSFTQVGKPNELQKSAGPDTNHFDPRYFGHGIPWQLADLENSERAYELARNTFEAHGRELINCTDGGKLEVFMRMKLEDFLSLRKDREPEMGEVK